MSMLKYPLPPSFRLGPMPREPEVSGQDEPTSLGGEPVTCQDCNCDQANKAQALVDVMELALEGIREIMGQLEISMGLIARTVGDIDGALDADTKAELVVALDEQIKLIRAIRASQS